MLTWLNHDHTNKKAQEGHRKWRVDHPCPSLIGCQITNILYFSPKIISNETIKIIRKIFVQKGLLFEAHLVVQVITVHKAHHMQKTIKLCLDFISYSVIHYLCTCT